MPIAFAIVTPSSLLRQHIRRVRPRKKRYMHTWHSLAYHGDEWIVAYASIPAVAMSASLFSIGHAVELYLKAAHAARFGDVLKAIGYGHRVRDLWSDCRTADESFMPTFGLREHLFDTDLLDSNARSALPQDDQMHYLRHQGLYLVFKHLQDLKYFGLPWKTRRTSPSTIGYVHPDPYWIEFFRELRSCIGYPASGHSDHVAQVLELKLVNGAAADYLRGLYA
jgi:hypothetical protein